MSNNGDKSRSKRRREAKLKQKDDALEMQYAGITFSARPSSGRPATPHRHFESSYTCEGRTAIASTSTGTDDTPGPASSSERDCGQVIHRHANGLCVVTAGDIIKKACSASSASSNNSSSTGDASNSSVGVRQVEFRIAPAEGQSVGSKRRKRMGKKTKKKKGSGDDGDGNGDGGDDVESSSGATRPSDILAVVELNCGTRMELNCCVLGTLLEINARLLENPSLLLSDPLLDGYLAVILPQGRLPIS